MPSEKNDKIRSSRSPNKRRNAFLALFSLFPGHVNALSTTHHYGLARAPLHMKLKSKLSPCHKLNGRRHNHILQMSSELSDEVIKSRENLKDDPKFIEAVNEVKDAAKGVGESAKNLTSAVVQNGPSILGRLVTSVVSEEML